MATALSQVPSISLPEILGTTALQIDMDGHPGALLHDLGSDQPMLYCRLMVDFSGVSAGELTIAGGVRADGRSVWQVVLDMANASVRVEVGASQISAALPRAIAWHCVEVELDASVGAMALRVNGIERGALNVVFDATRQAWVGGAFFSSDLAGTIAIDHWILSQVPIGVPISTPTQDDASDPRRWLVVYNRDDADSCIWADTYRARRDVPYANLCGLALPVTETVSAAQFQTMRQQIRDYLDENGLHDQVVGVLLGFNVPGYADVAGQGALTPISSYLHTDDTHGLPVVNPVYQSTIDARPIVSDYVGVRLTGRIDAPSLTEAIALLDRADALANDPLSHDSGSDVLIDINPDNPNVGPVYTQPVADWVAGDGLSSLRLPTTAYDAQAPASAVNDAVVWGWRDAAPSSGYFGSPAGRRAICMQFDPDPVAAATLRDSGTGDWLRASLQAGYAFAAAPSRAYSLSALPLPHLFFEGLCRGWTIAEAWLVAQPFVRDGLQLIGDPLMPINFPKAGYDIYGPVDRLDLIDFDSPMAALHAGTHELALQAADLPASGASLRYLVRRLDHQGRPDYGSSAVLAAIEKGTAITPALPAWPSHEGWRVLQREGQLRLIAYWPESLVACGIDAVRLVAQISSEAPIVLGEVNPSTGQHRVMMTLALPSQPTRYRFSVVQGPAILNTPWSSEVQPATIPNQPLTILEAS